MPHQIIQNNSERKGKKTYRTMHGSRFKAQNRSLYGLIWCQGLDMITHKIHCMLNKQITVNFQFKV